LFLFLLLLVFALSGCKSITKKITEKATESAIKSETGADVDLSKGSIKATTKDGETVQAGGSIKWPAKAPSQVPVYPGKITFATSDATSCLITMEKYEANVFNNYIKALEEKGFSKESETESDGGYMGVFLKDKCTVSLIASSDSSVAIAIKVES